jgi:SAM-dependent methyltransferase
MLRSHTDDVRRYYDRHTRALVALGQGGGAIHRAVWGPGVATRAEAFRFVEGRIAGVVRDVAASAQAGPAPHVVDLGCGVGASLCHLATLLPVTGTGVTLSPVQARAATARIAAAGLSDRLTCVEGDFCDLPGSVRSAAVAYAVESFVHGPDPRRFFAEAARIVRPGGALVVCDDVLRGAGGHAAERAIRRFADGWHAASLLDADALRALAAERGFAHVSTEDLTPYLELGRPRDRIVAAAAAVAGRLPYARARFGHLVGGSALQTCLARGWIGYELAVFRRAGRRPTSNLTPPRRGTRGSPGRRDPGA